MSKFVRNITIKTQFEGDEVTATFKPMSFPAALEFKALIAKARAEAGESDEDAAVNSDELTEFMYRTTKDHLVSFAGVKTEDGSDVTGDELFSAAYFVRLVSSLGQMWAARSMPERQAKKEGEVGN